MKLTPPSSVVLVDDDPDHLLLCRHWLGTRARAPLAVATYSCPATALDALRTAPAPDRIVVDLHMPQLSGPELVARLRACSALAEVTILMLSSSDREVDHAAARAAGASGYLLKPTHHAEWPALADHVLGSWRDADRLGHAHGQ